MNKFYTIFTAEDNKSYFKEETITPETEEPLGSYSKNYFVENMRFRTFKAGSVFDWHTAPQKQFIIYQEGEVEVHASGGEKIIFRPGDVLLAADTKGKGHISRTITDGKSIILTVKGVVSKGKRSD